VRYQDNLVLYEVQDGFSGKTGERFIGDGSGLYYKRGNHYVDVRDDIIYYGVKAPRGGYLFAHQIDRKAGILTMTDGRQFPCIVSKP
jgi:hypothetical protein